MEAKEIQIQIKLVKNPNELNNLEKVHQGMQFTELCDLLPIDDSGWTGLWKKKHAIEMAGISMDEVIAIVGMAGIGSEYKVHPREFAEFIKKFLTEVFGRKNLLSCVVFASPQKEVYSHFLVYPLNGRQLNPEQWIDSRSRQLSHKIRMDFTHQISDKFGIDVKRESKGGNGHTEYLDNFPKITLSKETIDLYYMLVQLSDELSPVLAPRGNTVTLHLDENLTIEADPEKLARVFNNILKNAASYSFPHTEIVISAEKLEHEVIIRFQNSGEDIPNEALVSLFNKFYRVDQSRSSDTGGTGLGLAIAKEIVTLHGGAISASSKNHVVTFTVSLPLSN